MSLAAARAPALVVGAGRLALGRRVMAAAIDVLAYSLILELANSVFGVTRVPGGLPVSALAGNVTRFTTRTEMDWWWSLLLWIGYFAILEGLFCATAGKAIVGLRVTDLAGRRIGWRAALIRNAARPLDALPFLYLLGGAFILTSAQGQRIGDRLAGTTVIPMLAVDGAPPSRAQRRRRLVALLIGSAILVAYAAAFDYYQRPPLQIESDRNTGQLLGHQQVGAYTLGAPHWGDGTVTYPITLTTADTLQSCTGEVTLQWTGFISGWQQRGGRTDCTPVIHP